MKYHAVWNVFSVKRFINIVKKLEYFITTIGICDVNLTVAVGKPRNVMFGNVVHKLRIHEDLAVRWTCVVNPPRNLHKCPFIIAHVGLNGHDWICRETIKQMSQYVFFKLGLYTRLKKKAVFETNKTLSRSIVTNRFALCTSY